MLIADRAALLLLDPDGRRRVSARSAAAVLAGALLADLVLAGRVVADLDVTALRVLPGRDPVPRLAAALGAVTLTSGAVRATLRRLVERPLWAESVAELEKAGALVTERRHRLLVFPVVRWWPEPAVLGPQQESVAAALTAAGVRRAAAAVDPATVSLVALLAGVGGLGVVPGLPDGVDPGEAAAVLATARTLPADVLQALADIETAVPVLLQSAGGGDSGTDGGGGYSGDGGHHGHGHHGGHSDGGHSDGGSSDGGGGDGGGGGGGD
ncbi:GPP34 family phosphoprotein [Kineococcus sp. GCM10028916]|uniref:GPP34 family phosphoprotein n=1 Tax=Kineococcus sp. GCM10028916 TaxID=3273394 RepID=UPI003627838F